MKKSINKMYLTSKVKASNSMLTLKSKFKSLKSRRRYKKSSHVRRTRRTTALEVKSSFFHLTQKKKGPKRSSQSSSQLKQRTHRLKSSASKKSLENSKNSS